MAACQRCLEEFDALLEAAAFASPVWGRPRRHLDAARVANMLLAAGPNVLDGVCSTPGALRAHACVGNFVVECRFAAAPLRGC